MLTEAAESVQSGDVRFNTDAAEQVMANGGPFALIAYVQLAIGEHLRRLAVEARPAGTQQQDDRPFRDEPTEVLRHALALASVHASQAARFRPQDQNGALPAVAELFQTELQHREGQPPADQAEQLVHVGWWCWRGDSHGHLATMACRSDNVPIHVPAEWADEMRAVLQRIEDGDDA
ncbi:hypothetical protein DV517_61900 [Streptomyces sp. S816]|nr:hypothetical protein DV517_61900 [Streptomyces sp. S816]